MKRAVIIGATSGIGRELAIRLASDGWKIGIAGRRQDRLVEIQDRFGKEIVDIQVIDINAPDAPSALDRLLDATGAPDLFLHVSGVGHQNPELDEAKELEITATNCTGMVRIVSHFVNYVKRCPSYSSSHKVHIGVVTSVAGTGGLGICPAYSASKKMQITYLSALSQLARMERIPAFFTDIRPGFVATEILSSGQHYPVVMTVSQAVGHILRGLRSHRRTIIFDWRFRALTLLWNLIPGFIWERLTFIRTKRVVED